MLIPLKDRNPARTFPYVTIALIITNVYIFLLQGPFGDERGAFNLCYQFGFIPDLFVSQFNEAEYARSWDRLKGEFMDRPWSSHGLFARAQELRDRQVLLSDLNKIQRSGRRNEWLTLLTCLFFHGSLWHVLANMWFLWVFGNNIEDACGHAKFLVFYLVCGALASFGHMVVNTHSVVPTIGASGAISGIMGAYVVLFPMARVLTILPIFYFLWYPIELPAFVYLGYWILIQIVLGHFSLLQPGAGGTAWFAHVGGFVAGLFLIFLFKKREVRSTVGSLKE
jgi:membrane associated rhomboid family serine protease